MESHRDTTSLKAIAKQLIGNFKWVAERHPVHDRMFVHGHSGGAQFAHRFAFKHPDLVSGVSAHSAGSWACSGGYGRINSRAKRIPFLISCGENDTQKSVPDSPQTRIEWYRVFAAALEKKGFVFYGTTWPEKGHAVPRGGGFPCQIGAVAGTSVVCVEEPAA